MRSPSSSPTTVAFSVAPCRMPRIVFDPSWPMPSATIICWPSNGVASINSAQNFFFSNRRPFAQPAHHLGHRQHHLHCRISIRDHFLEPLHGALRFNLIRFLHGDSPFFLLRKIALSLSRLSA